MAQLAGAQAPDVILASADNHLLETLLTERLLVLAPHMDDETLACGGTMLLHEKKEDVYCLFATDGGASPAPLLPWTGAVDPALPGIRRHEAQAATAKLGVPAGNLRFLDLPDGRLSRHRSRLVDELADCLEAIRPALVLVPFRHDVHPDHTTLNRAAREVLRATPNGPAMLEYFVYHRLHFVPGRDVRQVIDRNALLTVDTVRVAAAKRDALDCYVSQTTIGYPWQDRPILTDESMKVRCDEPEMFLATDPAAPLSAGLGTHSRRIRLSCLAARHGKRPKDRARAFVRWLLGRGGAADAP